MKITKKMSKKKEKLPLLTKQSFVDAGGRELFGKLKMLGLVYNSDKKMFDKTNNLDELIKMAKSKYGKVDYIFDIKDNETSSNHVITSGTAYKKTPWYPFKNFTW